MRISKVQKISRAAHCQRTNTRKLLSYAFTILVTSLMLSSPEISADELESDSKDDKNRFFALPMELDADYGAGNGDATILRIMPLYGRPSKDNWKIVHMNLLVLADAPGGVPGRPGNPNPLPGDKVFGISDLLHASFFTPPSAGNPIWGYGAMLSVPIASDSRLGSGKWSAGPAFRFSYKTGPWTFGGFGGQLWSFAGSDHRNDVSQLMIRGSIRRQLKNEWYFVSAPIITANWKADGEKWLVPVGGGIGKVFNIGTNPWAMSVQGYYNVVKPLGAPDWSVRLSVIAAINFGN